MLIHIFVNPNSPLPNPADAVDRRGDVPHLGLQASLIFSSLQLSLGLLKTYVPGKL